jgi:hypothetical protein
MPIHSTVIGDGEMYIERKVNGIMRVARFLNFSGCKRSSERKRYEKEVVFSHANNIYRGIIKDISLGGAHIKTPSVNHLYRGDMVTVSIPFTTGENSVKRKGCIVWMNNEGFSIEFVVRR